MNKKKILITGSCGFTFGNFIRKLVYEKQPYEVISLDRLSHMDLNAIYWNKNHSFYLADVNDAHILRAIFELERPELVIHGANESLFESKMYETNVNGTASVARLCKEFKVKKMLYISTEEVYGHTPLSNSLETDIVNPETPFSKSKYEGEFVVRDILDDSDVEFNIARLSTSYGPRQKKDNFIPHCIRNLHLLKNYTIEYNSEDSRDWTHAFDCGSAILTILEKGLNKETYNVGSGQELSHYEVLNRVAQCLQVEANHKQKSGGIRYFMNTDKLKQLGWSAEFKFKDGLNDTIDWFLHNSWTLK